MPARKNVSQREQGTTSRFLSMILIEEKDRICCYGYTQKCSILNKTHDMFKNFLRTSTCVRLQKQNENR